MSYKALNNIGDILLNLGYGLHVKRKGKYFYVRNLIKWIILRNKILGNKNLFKVASTENKACLIKKKENTKFKKISISQINVSCSNNHLFPINYKLQHIQNLDKFIISSIFRTLEYSNWNVRRCLDHCQTFCNVFRK